MAKCLVDLLNMDFKNVESFIGTFLYINCYPHKYTRTSQFYPGQGIISLLRNG